VTVGLDPGGIAELSQDILCVSGGSAHAAAVRHCRAPRCPSVSKKLRQISSIFGSQVNPKEVLIRDLEPFRQARPVWDRAAEMVLLAATTLDPADVAESHAPTARGARA
jgi:hypothetical protein